MWLILEPFLCGVGSRKKTLSLIFLCVFFFFCFTPSSIRDVNEEYRGERERERERRNPRREKVSIDFSHFGIEFQDQPTEVSICFHNLKDQFFFSCYAPICSSPFLIPIFVPLHLYGFVSCLGSGGMCERGRDWWVLNVGFFLVGFFFFFFALFSVGALALRFNFFFLFHSQIFLDTKRFILC